MKHTAISLDCQGQDCPIGRLDLIPTEIFREREEDDGIDIMFVGEGPGRTEVQEHQPFIGITGLFLKKFVDRAKRDSHYNLAYSNAVRCRAMDSKGKDRRPSRDELRRCRPFVLRDMERLDPKVVVLLGGAALESLLGIEDSSVTSERGRWRETEIAGKNRIVLSTWHPSFVNRQKNMIPVFYDDLRLAFRLADGWRPEAHWSQMGKSTLLRTIPEINEYCDFIQRGLTREDSVAVDVETKNLNKYWGNQLGMLQFSHTENEAFCIPLYHPQTPFDAHEIEIVRQRLYVLFDEKVSFKYWLAHGGLFEQIQIGRHILSNGKLNRTIRNVPMIDTLGFAYLLNENKTEIGSESFGLKPLSRQYLQFKYYDDATLEARSKGELLDLPLISTVPYGQPGWQPNLTDYGGMDGYVTKRLFQALKTEAIEQRYFKKCMMLLELLFSRVYRLISVIERNGFWADLDHLQMLKDKTRSPLIQRLQAIDKTEIKKFETARKANELLAHKASGGSYALFGQPWVLDLNKPAHVREWLVNQCGLEASGKTETGLDSVGKKFFEKYDSVDEVKLVKERRGLAKLVTSYINQLIEYMDPKSDKHEDCQDGRIRCDIHYTSTVTGRASSSNPNMQQQVKSDTKEKAAIKSIFKAEQPGVQDSYKIDFKKGPPQIIPTNSKPVNCLVQLDFRANEVGWWAINSQCPDLSRAIKNGKALRDASRRDPFNEELKKQASIEGDLHRQTASNMYSVPVYEVTKDHRNAAKSIVFGWMFGRGNRAISEQIKKSVEETSRLTKIFGERFPAGRDYLHGLPAIARGQLFVDSPIGRRRHLPGYILWRRDLYDKDDPTALFDEEASSDKDELRGYIAELDRLAKNSGIQGVASDAAFIGASLFCDYIEDNKKDTWLIQNVVHDSCVYQVPLAEAVESIAVAERCFTTDTMAFIAEHWGVNFICPIDVEFELGLWWGNLLKWDGTFPNLDAIVKQLSEGPESNPVKVAS